MSVRDIIYNKLPYNNYAAVSGTDPRYNSALEHEHYLSYSMQHLTASQGYAMQF